MTFEQFFEKATGHAPFPYQASLATGDELPELLEAPTGLGKTVAVLAGWLWRRRFASPAIREATPRRLVYCLPVRVLVEQTARVAREMLESLEKAKAIEAQDVGVHVQLGGSADDAWAAKPERDSILVGTQDMLLSRALNRGYGMSRYLWPVHFAWLNSDALWAIDETQLMGRGLATTAQLQAFRQQLGCIGPTHTLWMSATLDTHGLETVDHQPPADGYSRLELSEEDRRTSVARRRLTAKKSLVQTEIPLSKDSASEHGTIVSRLALAHHESGTLTLVALNQVERAQQVYRTLVATKPDARLALLHSRFRPADRAAQMEKLLGGGDRIVVATQVVEAGVDVSARTLITEIAPWASLVQRAGRCNRYGEHEHGEVFLLDIDSSEEKLVLPYRPEELVEARELLERTGGDMSPTMAATLRAKAPEEVLPVLRRRDLLDLFDTTPDLAGNDLDVSRYIRQADDLDVEVLWRSFEDQPPDSMEPPGTEEICRVSIGALKGFLGKKGSRAFRWNSVDGEWVPLEREGVRPGQRLLLPISAGGYRADLGWTGDPKDEPSAVPPPTSEPVEALEDDHRSFAGRWVSLREHASDARRNAEEIIHALGSLSEALPRDALFAAALRHDLGKAHAAFQEALGHPEGQSAPQAKSPRQAGRPRYRIPVGKAEDGSPIYEERRGFRHELASALAWLAAHRKDRDADLVAYLLAAHHGKVRVSLRAMPNEEPPPEPGRRFARGIWDGDRLPATELAEGLIEPEAELDLSPMELGLSAAGASWCERALKLRDRFGPFRLAYLEALVRVADWRASGEEEQR
jgi:CRISPR-associated endonuclease/helicase Cas3